MSCTGFHPPESSSNLWWRCTICGFESKPLASAVADSGDVERIRAGALEEAIQAATLSTFNTRMSAVQAIRERAAMPPAQSGEGERLREISKATVDGDIARFRESRRAGTARSGEEG